MQRADRLDPPCASHAEHSTAAAAAAATASSTRQHYERQCVDALTIVLLLVHSSTLDHVANFFLFVVVVVVIFVYNHIANQLDQRHEWRLCIVRHKTAAELHRDHKLAVKVELGLVDATHQNPQQQRGLLSSDSIIVRRVQRNQLSSDKRHW